MRSVCAVPECENHVDARGFCKTHYKLWDGYNHEQRRASWRAKNHRRRVSTRGGDFTAVDESAMRARTKRCPMVSPEGKICGRRLTEEPYLPNSKELDHIIPRHMFGTHTHGNVRIICRTCNLSRPKDGSDYAGPVTLWAQDHDMVGTRSIRGVCACGTRKIKGRCYACQPKVFGDGGMRSRAADGRRAAELRAEGRAWKNIAAEMGFNISSVVSYARKYGDAEVVAQWHEEDVECRQCGGALPAQPGRGRPRKYCAECRPPAPILGSAELALFG